MINALQLGQRILENDAAVLCEYLAGKTDVNLIDVGIGLKRRKGLNIDIH